MYCRKPDVPNSQLPAKLHGCPPCLHPWNEDRAGWGYVHDEGMFGPDYRVKNVWAVHGPHGIQLFTGQAFLRLFEPVTEQTP